MLDDTTVRTTDIKRCFLAVDPDGEHETGNAEEWTSRLHLTHEPKPVGSGYQVELTAKPTGQIRWTVDRTNPAEDQIYDGPIRLEDQDVITIYAYDEADSVTAKKEFKVNRREGAG